MAVLALVLALQTASAEELAVAVLFQNSDAGGRHRDGTREALQAYEGDLQIRPEFIEYEGEEAGTRILRQIIEEQTHHLVLGPTDSGVFLEALKQVDPGKQVVPVISSIVTTRAGNEREGWFFRTNVDSSERARTIYKHLDHIGFQFMAVFYSNTEFGRQAEAAFREELSADQAELFESLRYESYDGVRDALAGIFDRRPGAIGIFGTRAEIARITREIEERNTSVNPYRPLVFSVLDARVLRIPDLHFVSVAQREGTVPLAASDRDDVRELAFDTALLVLDNLDVGRDPGSPEWARAFRHRIENVLAGPPPDGPGGPRTDMKFDRFENQARAQVVTLRADGFASLGPPIQSAVVDPVVNWFNVRARRFGWAPLVSVFIVLAIAGGLSLLDLKRWNRRRSQFVGFSWPFVIFVAFNCLTALAIFVVLAETGRANWDGWLAAIGVGLGYSALLKTTLFQTEVGDEIGFASWYGRAVQWINDQIMVEKWRRESHKVNYVAYLNNLDRLEDCVCEVYQGYGADAEENDERVKELRAEADLCPTELQKRQVWARRALSIMKWGDLQAKGLVRSGLTEAEVFDPEAVVQLAAEHCMLKPDASLSGLRSLVLQMSADEAGGGDDAAHDTPNQLPAELGEELRNARSRQAKFAAYLRWLSIQNGYGGQELAERQLLPEDWQRQLSGWRLRPRRGRDARVHPPGPKEFAEKRRSPRTVVEEVARLRVADADREGAGWLSGTLRDLSESGAGIVVLGSEGRELGVDDEIEIRLSRVEGDAQAMARIRHAEPGDETVLCGVELGQLSDDMRGAMAALRAGA